MEVCVHDNQHQEVVDGGLEARKGAAAQLVREDEASWRRSRRAYFGCGGLGERGSRISATIRLASEVVSRSESFGSGLWGNQRVSLCALIWEHTSGRIDARDHDTRRAGSGLQ